MLFVLYLLDAAGLSVLDVELVTFCDTVFGESWFGGNASKNNLELQTLLSVNVGGPV